MNKSAVFLACGAILLSLAACSILNPPENIPSPTGVATGLALTPTVSPAGTRVISTAPAVQPPAAGNETQTPTSSPEATEIVASPTATMAPTATPGPRYVFQAGTPLGIANFVTPEVGCDWLGVGGQVFDLNNVPVSSLVVEIGGNLGGQPVSKLTLSGSTDAFGPGGYIVQIGNKPVASDGSLWIRLGGLDAKPLTDPLYFTTYAECERNLILINFAEVATPLTPRVFLPSILREPVSP